jgi:uncharacterized SAM-binding protein YcdF (DUF218 family)
MKSGLYSIVIVFIVIVIYVSACRKAGSLLVIEDKLFHADAIVILMGSLTDRFLEVSDLYKQGLAEKVILVETDMNRYKALEERGIHIISYTEQAYNTAIALGIPADNIILLPGDATSTQEEAIVIRQYLSSQPEIDTLILVSSAPHTRRASMIFNSAFRKARMPIHIICCPSIYTNFYAERWWKSKEGIQAVLLEYMKIACFLLIERRYLGVN